MKLLKVKLDFHDFFFNIKTFIELHVFVVFFLKIVRVNFFEMKERRHLRSLSRLTCLISQYSNVIQMFTISWQEIDECIYLEFFPLFAVKCRIPHLNNISPSCWEWLLYYIYMISCVVVQRVVCPDLFVPRSSSISMTIWNVLKFSHHRQKHLALFWRYFSWSGFHTGYVFNLITC